MANIQIQNSNGSWEELFAIKGDTGATPDITMEVVTLPPGSNATVTRTGTAENPVFTLGVPRGDRGYQGESLANGATLTDLSEGLALKLDKVGGSVSGHVYLTGASPSSSTGSTSQLVFGTPSDNHVAISSNTKAIVINPSTTSTANQIVLYLDKASVFPSGINANVTGNLTGTASKATADSDGNTIKTTYAKLASPSLTGTPTAPTAAEGTSNTQVATTAFVATAVANKTSISGNAGTATKLATARTISLDGDASGSIVFDGSVDKTLTVTIADNSHNHVISNVDGLQDALDDKAPLASPSLTGTPTAPTAAVGANTTQIATTAFVTTAISNVNLTTLGLTASAAELNFIDGVTSNIQTQLDDKASTSSVTTSIAAALSNANQYTDTKVAALVDSSPETLDTLNELAAALGDDPNFATTVANQIGTKANDADVVKLSGDQTIAGTKTFSSTISGSINGNAATATKATQDASGNVITTTYETKANVQTQLDKKLSLTGGTISGNLTVTGDITGNQVFGAVWNDYAEFFARGEQTEVGDFIALSLDSDDEVYIKASRQTSKSVGIHSNTYGHLIGGEPAPDGEDFVQFNLPKFIPVGLVGRCFAKIVGPIIKGDMVVISDIPGVGQKFNPQIDNPTDIIGMAVQTKNEEEIGLVKVKLG